MKASHALITGATSGIGEELAISLAKKKVALTLTGRNEKRLQQLCKELSSEVAVITVSADLAKVEGRKAVLQMIDRHPIDLLINAAGFGLYGESASLAIEDQVEMVEVNVNAALEFSLSAVKKWIREKRKGTVLNISSAIAFFPAPRLAVYAASKAFLLSFSKTLDYENRKYGIRVLTSCPGKVHTSFARRAAQSNEEIFQPHSMSVKKAASEILWQIDQQKRVHLFDWRYRLGVWLSHLFPENFVERLIETSIEKRQQ